MLFNNKYPYTDFHELNLDWIIKDIQKLHTNVKELYKRITQAETKIGNLENEESQLKKDIRKIKYDLEDIKQKVYVEIPYDITNMKRDIETLYELVGDEDVI